MPLLLTSMGGRIVYGTPNVIVAVAQVAYVLLVAGAYLRLPPRRAVLVATIVGFLLLPVFEGTAYEAPLLRTKSMLVGGVVLLGAGVADWRRLRRFRPGLLDLPMALLCLAPVATSLSNDLGLYDGLQGAFEMAMSWGAPYLLGRLYLGDPAGLRALATAVVVGAMAYVPLCLWEVRMSPQLHHDLYGFRPHAGFIQTVRFGGYRPSVFMDHGLMVGMFMAGGALLAVWLWRTGARRAILGVPTGWIAVVLVGTSILTKSVGAILLLVAGLAVLVLSSRLRTAVLVLALAAVPPVYVGARLSGWSARELVDLAGDVINADRAQSVEFRIQNEDMLAEKAMERPWLGWGRWGRGRVYNESGKDISTTDGAWIIALSGGGLLALASRLLVVLLPALAVLRVIPVRRWRDPRLAATAALLVWLLLWGVDNLANSMLSPLFPLAAGALGTLYLRARALRALRSHGRPHRARSFTGGEAHPVGGHAA